ncbi:MAG: diguanylate cyclase [Pyrinomonadaceae bacterium]
MFASINLTVVYLLLAIFVSALITLYAWRSPHTKGTRAFALSCLASGLWMLGDLVARLSPGIEGQWTGEVIRFVGVEMLPVALLVFVHRYFGRTISKKLVCLLAVPSVISLAVMVTDPWHNLFFRSVRFGADSALVVENGPYFWSVHLPYSYLLLGAVFVRIVIQMTSSTRHYRFQAAILLFAFSIPFGANVAGMYNVLGNDVSYTTVSLPFFFSIVAFAIYRLQFLRSAPIAYESVFQNMRDGAIILDERDYIRDINFAASLGLRKQPVDVIGLHVREAFAAWTEATDLYDRDPVGLGEIEVVLNGKTRYLDIHSIPLKLSEGAGTGRIITIQDITDRHKHQRSLEALAFHDPLTRVANRRKFQEEFEIALQKARDTGESISLLYMDLNGFKEVNDRYGHDMGDQLLKYVAARMASVLRKPDLVGRLGGDEFAVLLHNCDNEGTEIVEKRILENAMRPFEVDGISLTADLSIGAATFPEQGESMKELLKHADREMYKVKRAGGSKIYLVPSHDHLDCAEM